MIGLHIIADLKEIDFETIKIDENILKTLVEENIRQIGLTKLGGYYHTFNKKNEITCILALAESHISIHTWPEKKYVSIDIFVCNLGEDNSQKAKKVYKIIVDFFRPGKIEEKFIDRESK